MAQIKIFYEPKMELLTVFWQAPRKNQICSELDDGIVLIKDADTDEAIGIELLSYSLPTKEIYIKNQGLAFWRKAP